MNCNKCDNTIGELDMFCSQCGNPIVRKENSKLEIKSEIEKATLNEENEICKKCNLEKRRILQNGKYSGKQICVKCETHRGICPICNSKLRTKKAQQCGNCSTSWHDNSSKSKVLPIKKDFKVKQVEEVKCPRCKSTDYVVNRKGFGAGKALVGAVLTGGIGLLGGFIGSKKIVVSCLKCGHNWSPSKWI